MSKWSVRAALAAMLVAGLVAAGCGGPSGEKPKAEADKARAAKADSKHEGWWCDEHGIPEAECSMCSAKVEKECKARGDWCKEHNRAMSQCFFCKPERREFYAAQYRAKLGKEPPPVPEFDDKKDKEKK